VSTTTTTPAWLKQPELGLCRRSCGGTRRKRRFVSKTLVAGAGLVQQALFADDVARQPGLLQRVDPRVKVLGLVTMLLAASLTQHGVVLVGLYVLTLVLAWLSCIPVGFFIRRVWLFVPVFTGLVVLPATLNLITPGEIVVPLGHWFGHEVGLTAQGLRGAALITTRVAVSISLVVLITLTTGWTRLLTGLRALRVPRMFIAVLAMAYRYLFHLLDCITDMYLARRARTVRPEGHASGRRFVAAGAGALFGKSHQLAEEVHQAMIARGYTGNVRTLDPPVLTRVDLAAGVMVVGVAVLTLLISHGLSS
jgi:cobalt/nickel transport system permease protein